jgi:hypothetical protein
MVTDERAVDSKEAWPERLFHGLLVGVLLALFVTGTVDAIRNRVVAGKMERVRRVTLALEIGLPIGLVFTYFPRRLRELIVGFVLGVFIGNMIAMVIGRCLLGFRGEPDFQDVAAAAQPVLFITAPLGAVGGMLVASLLNRMRSRESRASHPAPATRSPSAE